MTQGKVERNKKLVKGKDSNLLVLDKPQFLLVAYVPFCPLLNFELDFS